MSARDPRIAIIGGGIGGGIGGLTLAIALRQRGMAADVYEQAPHLAEIGAAVALSANSTRELRRLGVLDEVTAASCEPTELICRDWRTGDRVAAHPVRNSYQARFGAPCCGIHRADLQRALSGVLGCAWATGCPACTTMAARCGWSSTTAMRRRPTWWWARTACAPWSASG